ncbi:MAG: helix-turn-helix transcriptional regulator [Lentisphaeria bacterium]|nr:helix-turn-helix domain-containing protein [Lentisphaerota bacterium]MBR7144676.1 helix-turn-helix transcriptional regulator [Lentisphaeria bacterium]
MDLLEISQMIRKLRIQQALTVEQLAKKSGFSKGFISQVENFRITPSLKALNAISAALGVPLAAVLSKDPHIPDYTVGSVEQGEEIFRNDNERYGMRYLALAYEQVGRLLEPFIIEYRACAEERPLLMHDTEEFYVLLTGSVEFYIEGKESPELLKAGQTIYLKSNIPHRVKLAKGCDFARALVTYSQRK